MNLCKYRRATIRADLLCQSPLEFSKVDAIRNSPYGPASSCLHIDISLPLLLTTDYFAVVTLTLFTLVMMSGKISCIQIV